MAKHYPRARYPEGVVASTDVIVALQEQAGMDPVTATMAVNGQLNGVQLARYGLSPEDIGQLSTTSILNTATERDRNRKK